MENRLEQRLAAMWDSLPVGRCNAITYGELCSMWGVSKRVARKYLHDLGALDNGDNLVLIRSGKGRGFYRTDNPAEIRAYRAECIAKGKSIMSAAKKCSRVLRDSRTMQPAPAGDFDQLDIFDFTG